MAAFACGLALPATASRRSRTTFTFRKRSSFVSRKCAPTTRRSPKWHRLPPPRCTESEVASWARYGYYAAARCCGSERSLQARSSPASTPWHSLPTPRRPGFLTTRHSRYGFSGGCKSASRCWCFLSARWGWHWCSWPPRVCRAAHSPITRNYGAYGRGRPRRRRLSLAERWVAISLSRSSWH